jgi:hypothetical protein
MDKNRVIVEVGGKKLHLVLYKNRTQWLERYGRIEECWDILLEDLLDGAVDIDENIWYWYIDGRCYETTEEVL